MCARVIQSGSSERCPDAFPSQSGRYFRVDQRQHGSAQADRNEGHLVASAHVEATGREVKLNGDNCLVKLQLADPLPCHARVPSV